MKPYPYRISDYEIILVTEDVTFGNSFLDYFTKLYSPRNHKGFARVFVVQNCSDALNLISIEKICVMVVDDNIQSCTATELFTLSVDKKFQQLLSVTTKPQKLEDLELDRKLFIAETMLVFLEKEIDTSIDRQLPKNARVWHLANPATLEDLDLIISPSNIMRYFHIDWLRDPITRLPSARLMEQKAKEIINNPHIASTIINISGFDQVPIIYKFDDDRDKIEHLMADILEQCMQEYEDSENWVGHAGSDTFYIVAGSENIESIKQQIVYLFEKRISFLSFTDADPKQLSVTFSDFPYDELGLQIQYG